MTRFKISLLALLLILPGFRVVADEPMCEEAVAYFSSAGGTDGGTFFVMTCQGNSEPIPLKRSLAEQRVRIQSWSTPDRAIAYLTSSHDIAILSETDAVPRIIVKNIGELYGPPIFSPRGKYIAYIAVSLGTDNQTISASIRVTDLEGNVQTLYSALKDGLNVPMHIYRLGWSPDGTSIGYSYRQGYESGIALLSTHCLIDSLVTCSPSPLTITDHSGERQTIERQLNNELVDIPEDWSSSAWLMDQDRLAFSCAYKLCFLNTDGTYFERKDDIFVSADITASFGGEYLAYSFNIDIYLYNLKQQIAFNLSQTQDAVELWPVWIALPEGNFLLENSVP